MDPAAMSESFLGQLHAWHEFYLLVGTSAAALTGLLFVVISIGPEIVATRSSGGVRAFVTPTIVHFAAVLVVSALMLMPHVLPAIVAGLLLLGGLGALAYLLSTGAHKQWRIGKLDREDWICYIGLPLLSYLLVIAAAAAIWLRSAHGTVVLAAAMILLLVIGIRNAWDLVIWMARQRKP